MIIVAIGCVITLLYDKLEFYKTLTDLNSKKLVIGSDNEDDDEPLSSKYRGHRYFRLRQRRARGQRNSDE